MGGKNTNQLEYTLNNRGELLTYVLTLIPIGFYVFLNGIDLSLILIILFLLAIAAGLSWYRPQKELTKNLETGLVIGAFHVIYAFMVLMLIPVDSSLVFLGVMFSALNYYSFGSLGVALSAFFNIIIIIIKSLTLGDALDLEAFSNLVATLSMIVLLTYFVENVIQVARDQLDHANQANKDIKLEHQRLVSLVNNIGDAVVATDEEGRIQTYNGAALELLDTNTSLTGVKLDDTWELLDESRQPVKLIAEARAAGRNIRRSDLIIRYGENDDARLYVNITPIKLGFGETEQQGFTLIMRDITKEKSLDEERDEFISVVSHELRTPITITEGKVSNAQLMISKPEIDKDKLTDALNQAHDQVVFLSNMINDLSNLSRAERDDAKLDIEPIDPQALLEELMKSYEVEASQQGIEILIKQPKRHLDTIYTNRLYLLEILQNFVTNALKYTKKGTVTLSAQPAGKRVQFNVQDTGIGISKSDQKRLFEKFFRSEDYRTRESGGTGLGLYVTSKLAHKLNATIKVSSELNKGSTFTLAVPSLTDKN